MKRSPSPRRVESLTKAQEALKFYRFYFVDGEFLKSAPSPPRRAQVDDETKIAPTLARPHSKRESATRRQNNATRENTNAENCRS
jgi:hypothetical protein